MFEILHYQAEDGRHPFREWIGTLRDKMAKARIVARLNQVETGNLGDCQAVGDGIIELRIHIGAGYRIYCGRYGKSWIVLLCGGDKSSQPNDINRAKTYWSEWKARQR